MIIIVIFINNNSNILFRTVVLMDNVISEMKHNITTDR